MKTGIELIAEERGRQMMPKSSGGEGWTREHDDGHCSGELANAAACYAIDPIYRERVGIFQGVQFWHERSVWKYLWPWDYKWWKPMKKKRIKELIKAGALIAAEIDRLQRLNKTP